MTESGGTKEIFIDKDGVQTRITELTSYKNQADSSRTACTDENKRQNNPAEGVIHGGLFVSLVGASAVSGENWVTTLDSLGEAADALRVYHGAVR